MGVLFDISSKIVLEGDSTEALNYVFDSSDTDVVAAYSFRRLSPDYYGALVSVRNKDLNTEKDFYPLNNGKIDQNELMSYLGDSQAFLIKFYNQAINAKTYNNPVNSDGNAYALNNGVQPRIVLNKTLNRTNGLISAPLSQDTAIDYLQVDTSSSNQITGDMFAYFVGAHDGTSNNGTMFSKRVDDNNKEYEFIYTSPTNVQYSDSNSSVNLTVTASSDLRIHSFNRDKTANTVDLQVNNISLNNNSIPGTITATNSKLYIGARSDVSYPFLGDFQELVIFNIYKSSADKTAILNGVNKYYNVY
jgi:hypothetical protein